MPGRAKGPAGPRRKAKAKSRPTLKLDLETVERILITYVLTKNAAETARRLGIDRRETVARLIALPDNAARLKEIEAEYRARLEADVREMARDLSNAGLDSARAAARLAAELAAEAKTASTGKAEPEAVAERDPSQDRARAQALAAVAKAASDFVDVVRILRMDTSASGAPRVVKVYRGTAAPRAVDEDDEGETHAAG